MPDQAIAAITDSPYDGAVSADQLPQPQDVLVDRPVLDPEAGVAAPDALDHVVAADDLSVGLTDHHEEIEKDGGEDDLFSVDENLEAFLIYPDLRQAFFHVVSCATPIVAQCEIHVKGLVAYQDGVTKVTGIGPQWVLTNTVHLLY